MRCKGKWSFHHHKFTLPTLWNYMARDAGVHFGVQGWGVADGEDLVQGRVREVRLNWGRWNPLRIHDVIAYAYYVLRFKHFISGEKNNEKIRTRNCSLKAHRLVGKLLLRGWSLIIPVKDTNLQLSFAALQHLAVSSCQWGIFPLAFIIFQIFHGSEIKD